MATFEIEASHRHRKAAAVKVVARFTTRAEADAIAAQLPKSLRVRAMGYSNSPTYHGYIQFRADLETNNVNGGVNETGLKRYRSLRKHLARLGHATTWVATYANSYDTEEAFEAAIAN